MGRGQRQRTTRGACTRSGALGELRCLDAQTGALVWRRNILEDNGARNLEWGMAAAPLVVDDKVIVLPGGRRGKSVAAYDKASGDPVWTTLDDRRPTRRRCWQRSVASGRSWSSVPRVRSVSPWRRSRMLWEYPWANQIGINVAQPLVLGSDRVFLSAGYGRVRPCSS